MLLQLSQVFFKLYGIVEHGPVWSSDDWIDRLLVPSADLAAG
jgi:hypothetical protein